MRKHCGDSVSMMDDGTKSAIFFIDTNLERATDFSE